MTTRLGRRAVLKAVGAVSMVGCGGVRAVPAQELRWASGGPAAMKGPYPDPFADGVGEACKLTCSATIGPCYAKTLERRDISEGQAGLPMRLALLVVDERCRPIADALVDVWHAGPTGTYSGEDAEPMCTLDDPKALAGRWFRGTQRTDAKGRVDFDTCFPGWYRGRTVHVHFTVRTRDGHEVTSQLLFDDALVDAIVAREPIYGARGVRDTNNTNDGVFAADEAKDFLFTTRRMPDGVMLAAKAIVLQTHGTACETKGGNGPGGPGGPPPFGEGPGGPPRGRPPFGGDGGAPPAVPPRRDGGR